MPDKPSTFSLVLETANLELADLALLRRSLDSIAAQDLDVHEANEVVMVEGGEVPREALAALAADYPWLTILSVSPGTGYEEAKARGVAATSGDILVFFDADCEYVPGWLRGLLDAGLRARDDIGLLGGETMIRSDGPWGLASAMLFSFSFFSQRDTIYASDSFHWNNFAVRRAVLAAHPIPGRQALFRTSTRLYAAQLREAGVGIARQPLSRARHAAPNGWSHFFWRYLMFGHDAATVLRQLQGHARGSDVAAKDSGALTRLFRLAGARLRVLGQRARYLLREDAGRWWLVPVVAPLVLLGLSLMVLGYLSFTLSPRLLPRLMPAAIKQGTGFDEEPLR